MGNTQDALTAQVERETLYGTIPLLSKQRIYAFWDLLFVAGSFAVATWCYYQGAYIAQMVNFKQAIASVLGAVMFFVIIVALIGVISTRYGIDHWIYQRAVFGYVGVLIMAVVAIGSTWGWYAINAQMFGSSTQKVLGAFGADIGDGWLKPLSILCVVIGWAIAMGGPAGVAWSTRIMAPCLFAVGIFILVAVLVKSGGTVFSAGPIGMEEHTSGPIESYSMVNEWNFAFILSWYPIIGGVTRLVTTERKAHWGLMLGYGFAMVFFVLIATATALVMAPQLDGGLSTDPTDYLLELGGSWMGTLSLVAIGFANITTMTVGVYGLSVGTKVLRPTWDYRIVATVWTIWCGLLTVWGGIWEYYPKFVAVIGVVAGPAMALILVDYFFVRRQRISLRSMFDLKHGSYRYTGGFNIPAFVAFGAGVGSYFLLYDPINYVIRSSIFHYTTATGLATVVAGLVYFVLAQIPAVKSYLTKDATEPAVTAADAEAAAAALDEAAGLAPA